MEFAAAADEVLATCVWPYDLAQPAHCIDERAADGMRTHAKGAFEASRECDLVRRVEFRSTPKHGSGLNMAENDQTDMTRHCLSGRRTRDIGTLRHEIAAWAVDMNTRPRDADSRMRVDDARGKLKPVHPNVKV